MRNQQLPICPPLTFLALEGIFAASDFFAPTICLYSHSEKHRDMFNPAVTSGVDLFVYITIGLIAFVAALLFVDFRKTNSKTEDHHD